MGLLAAIDRFLDDFVAPRQADRLLVAFSGGPDSTALLWGLSQRRQTRELELRAVHVDHALDDGSGERAARARRLCARLGVPMTSRPVEVSRSDVRRTGLEAAARQVRYSALEDERRRFDAPFVLTGHHLDDQIETVLLRLTHGSGWSGLGGMRRLEGTVGRPLLELRRARLREELGGTGLVPAADRTNDDVRWPRNRLRHLLLPYLVGREPAVEEVCLRVASAARGARHRLERELRPRLDLVRRDGRASVSLRALNDLPEPLVAPALALFHRFAHAGYPPPSAATAELIRQLSGGDRISVDCGDGLCWEAEGGRLVLAAREPATRPFTYTLDLPGTVELHEIGQRVSVERSSAAAWMFQGRATRTGLGPALARDGSLTVRNRRPGDRIRPLGSPHRRRLKDVLIDRRVPRRDRDRLPLLCVGDAIAWVPGVTIDDAFRIEDDGPVWEARIESL